MGSRTGFCDEFEVISQRVVGEVHLKLVLRMGERLVDAIAFRQAPLDADAAAAGCLSTIA